MKIRPGMEEKIRKGTTRTLTHTAMPYTPLRSAGLG